MTPAAKVDLTPENNLFLTSEEFGRRGQFYFGLSAFEGFELTDAFAGERDTVCGVVRSLRVTADFRLSGTIAHGEPP